MMKKLFLFSIAILMLASFVLGGVTENNYVKYGEIDNSGNLITSNIDVNNVDVKAYVCSSANCASVSGILFGPLNTVTNFIQLTYPTTLESVFGYGIYVYKQGYIPYEAQSDYAGTGQASDYINYLVKLQYCKSNINLLTLTQNGGNIDVETNIKSPINHAGVLNYVPSEIASYYTVDVNVTLNVKKDDVDYYAETKMKNVDFSGNEDVDFSFVAGVGIYDIKLITSKGDDKCVDEILVEKMGNIVITEPVCIENKTINWGDWLNNSACRVDNTLEQKRMGIEYDINNCGFVNLTRVDYQNVSCNYNSSCIENRTFTSWSDWTNITACRMNNTLEQKRIRVEYDANNCGFSNATHEEIREINCSLLVCLVDSDCSDDYYGDRYCDDDDVYKTLYDFSCVNGSCVNETSEIFVKECDEDCEDGKCVDDDDDDNSWNRITSYVPSRIAPLVVIELERKTTERSLWWLWILLLILLILFLAWMIIRIIRR